LESEFKGSGSGHYEELCIQFNDITLASCSSVAEYGSKFQQILDGMKAVHTTVELPEPFTVQKFLYGLGDAFSTFKTTFNLQFTIVPIAGSTPSEAEQPAVSLRRTIKAAEEHESRSIIDDSSKAFFNGRSSNRTTAINRFTECIHCHRRHPGPVCWEVDDTNATQAWKAARNRRQGQSQPSSKRKRSVSVNDSGVTTMGKDIGSASHPAFIMLQSQALDETDIPRHQLDSLFYINNPAGEFMAVHRGLNLWNHWILDSGASGHLIGRKDVFVHGTYTPITGVESNGIEGAKVVPIGRGKIRIECRTSQGKRMLEIPGVQYSPNAGVNLLSLTEIWQSWEWCGAVGGWWWLVWLPVGLVERFYLLVGGGGRGVSIGNQPEIVPQPIGARVGRVNSVKALTSLPCCLARIHVYLSILPPLIPPHISPSHALKPCPSNGQ
jgi:hypothetical protein